MGKLSRLGARVWLYPLGVVLLGLLISLGFWQLDRAEQKRRWLAEQQGEPLHQPSTAQIENALAERQWVPVALQGEWLQRDPLFLDNRTREGRVGYEVLMPARLSVGRVVLVDLGWVEAPARRESKPSFNLPTSSWISGVVGRPVESFTLDDGRPEGWRLQRLDTEQAGQYWGLQLQPWVIWLSDGDIEGVTPRAPGSGTLPPERHLGYAVQWFALALALVVIAGVLEWNGRKRR